MSKMFHTERYVRDVEALSYTVFSHLYDGGTAARTRCMRVPTTTLTRLDEAEVPALFISLNAQMAMILVWATLPGA